MMSQRAFDDNVSMNKGNHHKDRLSKIAVSVSQHGRKDNYHLRTKLNRSSIKNSQIKVLAY